MKVAIDASSAATGGGVTYLREMLPRLCEHSDLTVGPILARPDTAQKIDFLRLERGRVVASRGRAGALGVEWRNALASFRPDVVFVPTEISLVPYGVPIVTMARNPCLYPGIMWEYPASTRSRFLLQRRLSRRSARQAAQVIAISKFAASSMLSLLDGDAEKVKCIYHGGPSESAPVRRAPGTRLLFVSNLCRYKNAHRLIRALERTDQRITLEIAGLPVEQDYARDLVALVRSLDLGDRVRFLGHLDAAGLGMAYGRADRFVWPSYAETFGHPLLEAHSHGLPIAAADVPVNREIAGDAAVYFDPNDVDSMAECLESFTLGAASTGTLPRSYSWDRCSAETAAVLSGDLRIPARRLGWASAGRR